MGIFTLGFILAHLLADFPFQTDKISHNKGKIKYLLGHIFIHLSITSLFTISILVFYKSTDISNLFKIISSILIFHFVIDFFKEKIKVKINTSSNSYYQSYLNAGLFLIDQLFHVVGIIIISQFFFNENYSVLNKVIVLLTSSDNLALHLHTQIVLTLIMIVLNIYFVGYLLSFLLAPFKPNNFITETTIEYPLAVEGLGLKDSNLELRQKILFMKDSPAKAGMLIGILERNIIVVLILMNSLSSIGFLIAMKALTRFKQFEDKTFAEYYLIGSMFSIIMALLNGYIIKAIW